MKTFSVSARVLIGRLLDDPSAEDRRRLIDRFEAATQRATRFTHLESLRKHPFSANLN